MTSKESIKNKVAGKLKQVEGKAQEVHGKAQAKVEEIKKKAVKKKAELAE
ncbi:MAG: CsbD family protein [Limosilactobacillus sp.]|jgi:uncharacterized protein YjbJ (UPF0337 family)|nr:CsbD family protein [Limosilactobacillus sp.]MCI1974412.1 CsbD family protein [Limosilactobacillus sp.]MCI2030599.1 CsbD family protein [Limosilactobacillus sp.]